MKVLFICLGNICRSPAAEGIMNKLIEKQNLNKKISCDSAGTSSHHKGFPADPRMIKYAKQKGYLITSISRSFEPEDFKEFDWIVTMDDSNYHDILSLAKQNEHKNKVLKMADFCHQNSCDFIPDPYYQEDIAFLNVIELLEESCTNLLRFFILKKEKTK